MDSLLDSNFKAVNANTILAGFPKCATTSFAQWLQESPEICLTGPKETYLFCPEYQDEQKSHLCEKLSDNYPVRVEATTLNSYSQALISYLEHREVKVIIIVRNIDEVAVSWHMQMKKAGYYSDSVSLSHAYENSTSGDSLKNYKNMFSHGKWVTKWIETLGHERVLLLRSEDVSEDPNAVSEVVKKFLDLKSDLPISIPRSNQYSVPRYEFLYRFVRTTIFKNTWYGLEEKYPRIRKYRVYLRENILLRKVEKENSGELVSLYPDIVDDQVSLRNYLRENSEFWRVV